MLAESSADIKVDVGYSDAPSVFEDDRRRLGTDELWSASDDETTMEDKVDSVSILVDDKKLDRLFDDHGSMADVDKAVDTIELDVSKLVATLLLPESNALVEG